MILDVQDLRVGYGRAEVLRGVTLGVEKGEIVVVIGPNGAGKSTLLKVIAGLLYPIAGRILFRGDEVGGKRAYALARHGMALIPEGRQVFPDLSVHDNLLLGAYHRLRQRQKAAVESDLDRIFNFFPVLSKRRDQLAGTLSGGEQQMLAISRGLMSSPELLLMDEPSLGLAPRTAREIFRTLKMLNEQGKTILLVEQLAWLGLEICNRGYLLEKGAIVLSGTRQELLSNSRVIETYVGRKAV
ncbi:MAG TPA: ABC transporter ATP-binding protein [Candidatus Latescibacteria bacterium]|nr:ABC transporter ATP-binding protein [Candidatus Latescibacterota bacterium]